MNFYQVLGVSKEEVDRDVSCLKAAFKRRALEVHPDKRGGDGESFKTLSTAYRILSESKLREIVDCFYPYTVNPEEVYEQVNEMFPGMDLGTACKIFKIICPIPSSLTHMTETEFLVKYTQLSPRSFSRSRRIIGGAIFSILLLIHILYFS
jgi:curved DNA-binding protein CbpA